MAIYSIRYPKLIKGRTYYRAGYVETDSADKARRKWRREFKLLPIHSVKRVKRAPSTDAVY